MIILSCNTQKSLFYNTSYAIIVVHMLDFTHNFKDMSSKDDYTSSSFNLKIFTKIASELILPYSTSWNPSNDLIIE